MRNVETKRISIFLLILFVINIIAVPVFAEDTKVIDLEVAQKLARENSRAFRSTKLMSEKVGVYSNQAKDAYNDLMYSSYNTLLNEYLILKEREATGDLSVVPRIAMLEAQMDMLKGRNDSVAVASLYDKYRDSKNAYTDANQAVKDFEEQLNYIVENQYTMLLNLEKTIGFMQKTLDLKNQQLHIERVKKGLGLSLTVDIDKLAVDVSSFTNQIKDQKTLLKTLKWQFNDTLGREYDAELKLKPFTVNISFVVPNYNDLLASLNSNYVKIEQLQRDIKDRTGDIGDENYRDDSNAQALAKVEIKEKELSIEDIKLNLKTTTQNLINNLTSKQKLYQLAEISYNTAKQNYEWDKQKYELGMIARLQLASSELAYLDAENKKTTAGYDYLLAKHEIELAEKGILLNNM